MSDSITFLIVLFSRKSVESRHKVNNVHKGFFFSQKLIYTQVYACEQFISVIILDVLMNLLNDLEKIFKYEGVMGYEAA